MTLSSFFLSKYEMTQGQWLRIMDENPSYWNEQNRIGVAAPMHPVETVSWEDCTEALRRLSLVLPTEAQWEYGARAGTDTPWWTGSERESLEGAANVADVRYQSMFTGEQLFEKWLDDGYAFHAPVGSFRPNAFGLHDMAGNVWEWCRDWFGDYAEAPTDGSAQNVQQGTGDRVFRGGSWSAVARLARCSARYRAGPGSRHDYLGSRPARLVTE